jgi:ABC-type dipeptide/oligopeptide/nickel transport system ATPase subunit
MRDDSQNLLEVHGLSKTYTQGSWWQQKIRVRALDNVSLALRINSTTALVGESGAGKSTLAMCLAGLEQPDAGVIRFEGETLTGRRKLFSRTQEIQMIFQDSAGALSPRMSTWEIVEEPLRIRRIGDARERRVQALEALEQVGLPPGWANRKPHEFSGGQRQRIAIARAMVCRPKILILDEPLAGLDLSVQGQIMNLLLDLQASYQMSYLFISHNLELVSRVTNEILVMHQGRIAQAATADEVLSCNRHRSMSVNSRSETNAHSASAGGSRD